MRLDALIALKFDGITRNRAKVLIETGNVKLNGAVITKPSYSVDENTDNKIDICTESLPYVSRGGLKLRGALIEFNVDPKDKICIDIGASTGGFTDCLLQNGARKVYAVDSGSNQLALSLRNDDRVVSMEHFNARDLSSEFLEELCSLAVADVSFISQTYILPAVFSVLTEEADYIGLIKPQFECGKSALNKNGIVKDKKEHYHAIMRVITSAEECGFKVKKIISSPITGGDGNKEFLFHAIKTTSPIKERIDEVFIRELVSK